ncbi:ty3-gypsy retroelement transposase [Cucumis melo var. makuwa]|uniref:Ty3-gypsy retroelement transposase n=1 Tax=Cucumis melo var. makuwa TaxID=1194695 RepID=A0A5D3CYE3_CUCMM|nr:ty3-gypsy retroelement transposase [Cucumis melo var. makuwa]
MMKLTLKIENREKVRKECELISVYGSKFQYNLPKAKENSETKSVTATTGGSTPMRTITLSEVTEAKYYAGHHCKAKEYKELRMLVVRDDGEEFEIIEEEVEGKVAEENTIELLPLELGGVDVILGMHWLHSLGVAKVDWKHLITIFQHEGRKVIIRGDPSLTKKGVSLKSMIESWVGEDQGFLVECRAIRGNVAKEEL